jgi:adenylate cyclase
MAGLTVSELASGAGCTVTRVERLVELGLVEARDAERPFRPADIQRVRLVAAFEEAGIAPEDVARGVAAGVIDYSIFEAMYPEPPSLSATTYADLAARIARPVETVLRLVTELGFAKPRPEDRVREDDEELLLVLFAGWEGAPDEIAFRVARAYGESQRRLAESLLPLWHTAVADPIVERGGHLHERVEAITAATARIVEAGERLTLWLNRRHLERVVVESSVVETEAELERLGITPARQPLPPAIAFLDLTGYTALTEERGDEAAAELAASLAGLVDGAARAYGGRPVKWLGDGVMFHFSDPGQATLAALELVETTPRLELPPSRVGVNAGPVIFRDGDYFGRTVNLAARIVDYARPGEVLLGEEAAAHARAAGLELTEIPLASLKGVTERQTLYRAHPPDG